jgi:hypothetical protein
MNRRIRPNVTIFWMLIATAWIAIAFSVLPWPSPDTAKSLSDDAKTKLLIEYNVSVAHVYRTFVDLSPPPEVHIFASDGRVARAACNPHVDLTNLALDPPTFCELIPILRDLIPEGNSSHVAIYVHSNATGRGVILQAASVSLPHCVIFDESQSYNH